MKNGLSLDLLKIDNSLKSWVITFLMCISFIALIVSIFVLDNLLYTQITLTFFLCFLLYSVFFEREIIIGKIHFNEDEITINNTSIIIYTLQDLKSLTINYNGAEGTFFKSNPKALFLNDGTNNYISFIFNGERVKYKFKVDRNNILKFNSVINLWRNKLFDFNFLGKIDTF